MSNLATTVLGWLEKQRLVSFATVVETQGSAPRRAGAMLAVRDDGVFDGSVSAGCLESGVIDRCIQTMGMCQSALLNVEGGESELWSVGLTCGGSVSILIESPNRASLNGSWRTLFEHISDRKQFWSLSNPSGDGSRELCYRSPDESGSIIHVHKPAIRLLIVGANHVASVLCKIAHAIGIETMVFDPRSAYVNSLSSGNATINVLPMLLSSYLAQNSVDTRTAVLTLAHDDRIDIDALASGLRADLNYVGALGGAKTQLKQRTALQSMGFSEDQTNKIHGPIGIPLNVRTADGIAVSIIAEVLQELDSDD